MADYKSILDQVYEARRQSQGMSPMDPRTAEERAYEQNFFAMSPLKSRPWDMPELPERELSQEQIDTVLTLSNPPRQDDWSKLLSIGTPSDLSMSDKISMKASIKGHATTPVDTQLEQPKAITTSPTDVEMENALADRQQNLLGRLFLESGAKAGRALAQVSPREPLVSPTIDALIDAPVKDIEQKREAQYKKFTREKEIVDKTEASDPNSQHSVSYRNLAKSMLDMQGLSNISKAIEGLSAEQIDKKFPMISNIVTAKMAQDSRKEQSALMAASKLELKEAKKEADKFSKESLLSNRVAKVDDNLKYSQGVYNLDAFKQAVVANPSGALDVALIYDYVKALDPQSAVREGEVDFIKSSSPFLANVGNIPKRITKGDILPAKVRQQILQNIEMFNAAKKKQFLSHLKPITGQMKAYDLNPENILLDTPGVSKEDIYNIPKSQEGPKQDDKVSSYATQFGMTYDQAKQLLMKRGYKPNE